MNILLQNIVDGLKNYSQSLQKTSILINKPWTLIDSDQEIQRLIFKKNKELIISKDGQVVEGSWDYFPEAKSLLINRGKDKLLCNEGFIDDGVLILKLDGTKNKFFVLANENVVPDLDALNYLKKLRQIKLGITTRKLTDGRILEMHYWDADFRTTEVTIDAEPVISGTYEVENSSSKYVVEDSQIVYIFYEVKHDTKNGQEIFIEQSYHTYYEKGNKVWLNGKPAPDGEYKIIKGKNIIVKDGKIFKKKLF